MTSERIYLAGPEVFLPDPLGIAAKKKEICAVQGFVGVFPLDNELALDPLHQTAEAGWQISQADEGLMRSCDLVIANMTPFRGPSMDVGTAYEMGFMRGLGRPVFGYTNVADTLTERTCAHLSDQISHRADGITRQDADGLAIEAFDMVDNCMLDGAVLSSGSQVIVHDAPGSARYTDLTGFEACVHAARAQLQR